METQWSCPLSHNSSSERRERMQTLHTEPDAKHCNIASVLIRDLISNRSSVLGIECWRLGTVLNWERVRGLKFLLPSTNVYLQIVS